MSWLKRTILFIKLAVVCALIFFSTKYPGDVVLRWFGYRIDMAIPLFLSGLFLLLAAVTLIHTFWRRFWEIPKNYIDFLQKRRQQKGEALLVESLTAIAALQPEEAQSSVELAKILIPSHPLTVFVAAQSAHMLKDSAKATDYFTQMLKDPTLKFLGLRGLILQAKEHHEWLQVEKLLKQALSLRPDSPWVQNEILHNQLELTKNGQDQVISTYSVHRHLPKISWQKHQASMAWLKAERHKNDPDLYKELCLKAHDHDRANPVYAATLAEIFFKEKNTSRAQGILENTYEAAPHRLLMETWCMFHKSTPPLQQYKTLEKLTKSHGRHPETLWVLANAALKAELWGQCREFLSQLLVYGESQTLCTLMAQLEEAEYPENRHLAHQWWQKAASAPRQEYWACNRCHTHYDKWQVICSVCSSIHTVEWHTFGEYKNQLVLARNGND
jgi:HemY protein